MRYLKMNILVVNQLVKCVHVQYLIKIHPISANVSLYIFMVQHLSNDALLQYKVVHSLYNYIHLNVSSKYLNTEPSLSNW